MDPSFTDLPGESFAPSRRRKGSQVLCSKAEPKKPRKRTGGDAGRSDPRTSYQLEESAQRDQDEPWVDRYWPRAQVSIIAFDICSSIHEHIWIQPTTGLNPNGPKWLYINSFNVLGGENMNQSIQACSGHMNRKSFSTLCFNFDYCQFIMESCEHVFAADIH